MVPLASYSERQGCTLKSDAEDRFATLPFKDRNFVSRDFKQSLQAQPHTWMQPRRIQQRKIVRLLFHKAA